MQHKVNLARLMIAQAAISPMLGMPFGYESPPQMRLTAVYGPKRLVDYDINQHTTLSERFNRLASQWQEETWFMSNADNMARHPAYQEIIRMGKPAVPLILSAMRKKPHHWFWALNIINRFDVVKKEHAGNIKAMTRDWLEWGVENGLI